MPGYLTELVVTFLKEKSVREIVSAPLSEGVEVVGPLGLLLELL